MAMNLVVLQALLCASLISFLVPGCSGAIGTCHCYNDVEGEQKDCGCINTDDSGDSACASSCQSCLGNGEPDSRGVRTFESLPCSKYRYELDCFPGSVLVELQNGTFIRMDELEVGHKIRSSDAGFSEVHLFTHRMRKKTSMFVAIHTSLSSPLLLTPGHYLYVNGAMKAARQVIVGDRLVGAHGEEVIVKKVDSMLAEGLYNPHTMNGNLTVNGILVSALTDAVTPFVADTALSAARTAYWAFGDIFGNAFDEGAFHSLAPYFQKGDQEIQTQ
eukprot:m.338230 g.338230  ORF g.338230 m.338230 type:complete len:274 (-) comp18349_c0_seq1:177-998(-)